MVAPLAGLSAEQAMTAFDKVFGSVDRVIQEPTPYRRTEKGGDDELCFILLPDGFEIGQVIETLGRSLGERYLLILSYFYARGLLRKKTEKERGNFFRTHNKLLRELGGERYARLVQQGLKWKHLKKSPAGYVSGLRATSYMLDRDVLSVDSRQRYRLTTKHAIRVRREFQKKQRETFAAKHAVYRKIAESTDRLTFDSEAACRYVTSIKDDETRKHRKNVVEQLILGEKPWAIDQQGRNYTMLVAVPRDVRQFFSCGEEPLFVVDISSSQPMLHALLYPSDSDERKHYKALVEGGTFWDHMNKAAGSMYDLADEEQKAQLKEAIFREVFYAYREGKKGAKGSYAKAFKAEFPILWDEINARKKMKGYKASGALAKEMQHIEAWAVFDAINVLRDKPYPLISIHDAIVTTQDGVADATAALRSAFVTADLTPRLAAKRLTMEASERERIMAL
jgi:hypothetical protein